MAVVVAPRELVDRLRESRNITEQAAHKAVDTFISNLEKSCRLRQDQAIAAVSIIYSHGNGSDKVHTIALELNKGYIDADKIKNCIMRTEREAFPNGHSAVSLHRPVPKESYLRAYSPGSHASVKGISAQSRELDHIGSLLNTNKKRPQDVIITTPRSLKSLELDAAPKQDLLEPHTKIPIGKMPEVLARYENGETAARLAKEFGMKQGSFYNAIANARKNGISPDPKLMSHQQARTEPLQTQQAKETAQSVIITPTMIMHYVKQVDQNLAEGFSREYRTGINWAKVVIAAYMIKATEQEASVASHIGIDTVRKMYMRLRFKGVQQHTLVVRQEQSASMQGRHAQSSPKEAPSDAASSEIKNGAKRKGKPYILTDTQINDAMRRIINFESTTKIGRDLGVNYNTVLRAVRRKLASMPEEQSTRLREKIEKALSHHGKKSAAPIAEKTERVYVPAKPQANKSPKNQDTRISVAAISMKTNTPVNVALKVLTYYLKGGKRLVKAGMKEGLTSGVATKLARHITEHVDQPNITLINSYGRLIRE